MAEHRPAAMAAPAMMTEFTDLTGLTSARPPKRYLWTDAFAVCNLLELERQTGESHFRELALRLVDQVHHVLGRHRPDDPRQGWISGLDEPAGEQHPTAGGLRIGKPVGERDRDEPPDEQDEWDRDGQYFHYLTKWMHALHAVSRATGDATYHRWAVELARTAHARFTYRPSPGGPLRMRWKMSIDLSYPLVLSQGHHDPLDGWITYQQLQAGMPEKPADANHLNTEIDEMGRMCAGTDWTTDDPLGIGGLLTDACRAVRLLVKGKLTSPQLLPHLLQSAQVGLQHYLRADPLRRAATRRLAFRELGLSIGLRGVERLHALLRNARHPVDSAAADLMQHLPIAEQIESFWLRPAHQEAVSWTAHREINMVMLATSLAPDSYLGVEPEVAESANARRSAC